MIGAAFALLLFRAPFGFVALLGIIALAGMIMRKSSVILVDQRSNRTKRPDATPGLPSWNRRSAFRPILLTAAAVVAMIPLVRATTSSWSSPSWAG